MMPMKGRTALINVQERTTKGVTVYEVADHTRPPNDRIVETCSTRAEAEMIVAAMAEAR